MPLSDAMKAEGWLPWDGGDECPVEPATSVTVKLRDDKVGTMLACELYWEHDGRADDIIAYKPEPSHD